MYSAIHSLPLDSSSGGGGSIDGLNLTHHNHHHHNHHLPMSSSDDAYVVLTTDPKPRLRWTSELHERFVDAVAQLGGPEKATPKTLMRAMAVKGLTLYHLKSHLQKFRLGKLCKETTDNSKEASCIAESQDTCSSSPSSSKLMAHDLNDGYQVTEALRVQMDVQRRLHEQLEVQRRLQLRIEAQSKYLQSILEKACKALTEQAAATAGLEAAREELSDLAINMDNFKMPTFSNIALALEENQKTLNLPDSCLTSIGSPISPQMGVLGNSQIKKRDRSSMFTNGELENGWMMTNIG